MLPEFYKISCQQKKNYFFRYRQKSIKFINNNRLPRICSVIIIII